MYCVLLRGALGANALTHQRAPPLHRETDSDARSSGDGGTGLLLRDFAFSDGDATGGAATAATGMVPSPGGGGAGGGAALAADALANGFTARAFALRAHRQWDQAGALEVSGGGGDKLGRPTLTYPFGALASPSCPGKSSRVNNLPKAKSKTRSKQNKDMHKCSSAYSERGVPLPVLTSGGE